MKAFLSENVFWTVRLTNGSYQILYRTFGASVEAFGVSFLVKLKNKYVEQKLT